MTDDEERFITHTSNYWYSPDDKMPADDDANYVVLCLARWRHEGTRYAEFWPGRPGRMQQRWKVHPVSIWGAWRNDPVLWCYLPMPEVEP